MPAYDLYKGIYERELTRRYNIESGTTLPITICSIIIALLYFFFNAIGAQNVKVVNILLICFVAVSFILFLCSLCFLAKAYNNWFKGFDYCEFPSPAELHKFEVELAAYNSAANDENKHPFDDYLLRKYVLCADSLTHINDRRSFSLYRAKTFLIICIFIEVLGLTIYVPNKINVNMSDTTNEPAKPAQIARPAIPTPQLPTEPTGRTVKGLGDDRPLPNTNNSTPKKQ